MAFVMRGRGAVSLSIEATALRVKMSCIAMVKRFVKPENVYRIF